MEQQAADDTEQWGVVETPDGCVAIQRNLNRLEKSIWQEPHEYQYMLGAYQLHKSFAEKGLGPGDHKLEHESTLSGLLCSQERSGLH